MTVTSPWWKLSSVSVCRHVAFVFTTVPVFLNADHPAKGGVAGVQFDSRCRWALHLHRGGTRTEPVLQRCQRQTAPPAPGESRCTQPRMVLFTLQYTDSLWHIDCKRTLIWTAIWHWFESVYPLFFVILIPREIAPARFIHLIFLLLCICSDVIRLNREKKNHFLKEMLRSKITNAYFYPSA